MSIQNGGRGIKPQWGEGTLHAGGGGQRERATRHERPPGRRIPRRPSPSGCRTIGEGGTRARAEGAGCNGSGEPPTHCRRGTAAGTGTAARGPELLPGRAVRLRRLGACLRPTRPDLTLQNLGTIRGMIAVDGCKGRALRGHREVKIWVNSNFSIHQKSINML